MKIDARAMDSRAVNAAIRGAESVEITDCIGQRFIGAGMKTEKITVRGIPGNALGAYLAGAEISVFGNAQDAVGDTMNDGQIVVHGNIGDAPGYAMRGGRILIQGNAGYRVGIHMKEYQAKKPEIIIGGKCGSFLGEYQAGGLLVVLGLTEDERPLVGNFPCAGMHGGKVFLRGQLDGIHFPHNVSVAKATSAEMEAVLPLLQAYTASFGTPLTELLAKPYWCAVPDSRNPYQQMYVAN